MVGTPQLSDFEATTSDSPMVALQVAVVPWPSSAVTVTVLAARLAQVKALFDSVIVGTPQLSDLEATMSDSAMLALPLASRFTVTFLHVTVGDVLSLTVTVAV